MYQYYAKLNRVIDGDTVVLDISLGFDVYRRETVRLLGIDCPEIKGKTKKAGLAAKEFTEKWFEGKEWVIIETVIQKRDGFGRVLASINYEQEPDDLGLVDALHAAGHFVKSKYDLTDTV